MSEGLKPPPKELDKKSGFKEILKTAILGGSLLSGAASDSLPPPVEASSPEHTTKLPAGLVEEKPVNNAGKRFQISDSPAPEELARFQKEHQEAAEQLKIKMAEELGIALVGPKEGLERYQYHTYLDLETVDWDFETLTWLNETLHGLPKRLYQKMERGRQLVPLQFVLVERGEDTLGGEFAGMCVACRDRETATILVPVPIIEKARYLQGVKTGVERADHGEAYLPVDYWSKKVIVHELAHVLTEPKLEQYVESIAHPAGLYDPRDLRSIFQPKIQDEDFPAEYHMVRYGSTNFAEFLSVASEFYIQGKEDFIKVYKKHLGPQRAELLYDGIKKEIFQGKEYNTLTNEPLDLDHDPRQ